VNAAQASKRKLLHNEASVSLTQTLVLGTIPESSTWAMMLIGFGGLGFADYLRAREWQAC
jgi:hypothetical protein